MLSVIEKQELWDWLDQKWITPALCDDLKFAQDNFILSQIYEVTNKKILEIGGGNSRVLRQLVDPIRKPDNLLKYTRKQLGKIKRRFTGRPAKYPRPDRYNECWNADRLIGDGNGPVEDRNAPGVKMVNCYVGEFSPLLPDAYFDIVFSVSVIEHVETDALDNFFTDAARVLKPGGKMYHAIDLYVFDPGVNNLPMIASNRVRIKKYLSFADRPDLGLKLVQAPTIHENLTFSCRFASNPDRMMYSWNQAAPEHKHTREIAQSISIKGEWVKTFS